jgi:hypothetical protein
MQNDAPSPQPAVVSTPAIPAPNHEARIASLEATVTRPEAAVTRLEAAIAALLARIRRLEGPRLERFGDISVRHRCPGPHDGRLLQRARHRDRSVRETGLNSDRRHP